MTDASLDLLAVLYAVPDTLNEGKQMIFFLHIKIGVLQHEIHWDQSLFFYNKIYLHVNDG